MSGPASLPRTAGGRVELGKPRPGRCWGSPVSLAGAQQFPHHGGAAWRPGPAKGDFVHSTLLLPRAVIHSPFQEQPAGAGPQPHLAASGPAPARPPQPRSALASRCPAGPGGGAAAPCSLAGGQVGQRTHAHAHRYRRGRPHGFPLPHTSADPPRHSPDSRSAPRLGTHVPASTQPPGIKVQPTQGMPAGPEDRAVTSGAGCSETVALSHPWKSSNVALLRKPLKQLCTNYV